MKNKKTIEDSLKEKAIEIGFSEAKITSLEEDRVLSFYLEQFVKYGYSGDMVWISNNIEKRSSPLKLWPEAKSALVVCLNYNFGLDSFSRLLEKENGTISVYAMGRDYHDIIKGKLKNLASWFYKEVREPVKVFVDTAPLMEKPLASKAGLGWQGKHTNLVSKNFGSWTFLGVILTSYPLKSDQSEKDHCGSCRSCLDICPTKAFPKPYQIDARRCISYLTIEHKGLIPKEFRKAIGNRIYGCDDCLAICPWNKFAQRAQELKLKPREDLIKPSLIELSFLTDESFRKKFSGSPIKRIGRDKFLRNVLIAIGNSCKEDAVFSIERLLNDPSFLVRGSAIWALKEILNTHNKNELFENYKRDFLASEKEEIVRREWEE